MHIAIVTETFPPEVNGVAMTLNRLASGLAAKGHEVQVVRPRQKKHAHAERPFPEILVPGLPLPGYKGLRFGLPARFRLIREWKQKRPDVLYVATEGPLGLAAISAARRLGIPVTSGFHTNFNLYMKHYIPGANRVMAGYLRWIHNRTWCTYTPSATTKTELESLGIRRVKVLGRGVDTQLFRPDRRNPELRQAWGADPGAVVPIFVSRIAAEKNLDLTASAFALAAEDCPDTCPVWVGDGPELARLQREYPEFHYAGMRSGEDLAAHYASGDLFIFPSTTETFGNVVTEAMASGLVVVAYDYAAPRLLIEDGVHGFLAPFDDPDAYLQAVRRALEARPRWAAIRDAARQRAENLSWDSVIDQFGRTLAEAVDAGSSSPPRR